MKQRWREWSARFAALAQREKLLITVAVLAGIMMIGYSLWIEPPMMHAQALSRQNAAKQTELVQLSAQVASMQASQRDPDAPNKAALAEIETRMQQLAEELRRFDESLISPQQMPTLLRALLARHKGLTLVGMRTLPPTPLIPPPSPVKGQEGKEAVPPPADNIYQHGIELKVIGSYGDLVAWLTELEASPYRLIWSEMKLSAIWPRSELTLTVYTLSLDEKWLVL